MFEFKDLGITVPVKNFDGQKVKMSKILNKKITILAHKIEDSDYKEKGDGKRLCLHFEMDGTRHIVFTSSMYLRNTIQQVPTDKFPLVTTIIEENDTFYFT